MIPQPQINRENPLATSERLKGVEEYFFSKKLAAIEQMNRVGEKVINLGIGSPDLAPHPAVVDTLYQSAAQKNNHSYQSYKGSQVLREAIAQWYHKWYDVTLDADSEILLLAGSKEGIMHVCMTYLNEGDGVLIPDPGYPTYASAARIAGANIYTYTLTEKGKWLPDLDHLYKMDTTDIKLMFVNYPHMPTGAVAPGTFFEELVAFAKEKNILIVNDNPYSFILNDKPISLLASDPGKEVVIELNSLSKSHNMAGWRVGFLCGNRKHISNVLRFKSNMDSGMFLPVQHAAVAALSLNDEWFTSLNKTYRVRQKIVFRLLEQLNCIYSKDQSGLFVWAHIPENELDGYEFSQKVLDKYRVFVTPGNIFGVQGNKYIRVSLCQGEKLIEQAIERCKNFSE